MLLGPYEVTASETVYTCALAVCRLDPVPRKSNTQLATIPNLTDFS